MLKGYLLPLLCLPEISGIFSPQSNHSATISISFQWTVHTGNFRLIIVRKGCSWDMAQLTTGRLCTLKAGSVLFSGFIFICESVSGVCICGRDKEHSNSCSKAVSNNCFYYFSQMMERKFVPLIILPSTTIRHLTPCSFMSSQYH